MKLLKQTERGSILLIFIITFPFLILIATYYMEQSLNSFRFARQDQLRTSAQLSADAGADFGIGQISQDNSWTGTAGELELHNDGRTRTTYQVTVSDVAGGNKVMAVVGRSYTPVTATASSKTIRVAIDLRPVSAGTFGIISGQGGLFMQNSAKVVGGDVFVNGEINMTNTAQIGLSTNPLNVSVAHQICPVPANATFPQVCGSGENGQPISISNTARIYGTVKATNQSNGANMSNPGLVSGSVTPLPLPTYDRAAQKAAATNNMTAAAASCSGSQSVIWPANTKITGNVTVGTKCKVTVMGDIWITGSLKVSNTASLIVSDVLGTTPPDIMVDNKDGVVLSQSASMTSNASGTGFKVYTFWSNNSCTPDCTTVTGVDLFNSRGVTTIALQNSASAPNTVFYAYWSQVSIGNSGGIGAIIGQTILMNNTGTLTFGAAAQIGGPVIYVVDGYRRD